MKYYSLKNIMASNALYNVIIGERSNGKTYACFKYAVERYIKYGEQCALVRRWKEDFIGKRGSSMFDALENDKVIAKLSKGRWTGVHYFASKWYLSVTDDTSGKKMIDDKPFCFGFSISSMEHDKSTSYPGVKTVIFDEFISRQAYIPDEFVMFMNVLSTIIRQRNDVIVFMLGNTVNKYCPYFKEMGLTHITKMEPGAIDLYQYGGSGLTVAVEYIKSGRQGKKSDIYFAFDNPKLSMITTGSWEIDIYPHCPVKYTPKNVLFRYYIDFMDCLLECEIVYVDNYYFTFIHRKTTKLKYPDDDLIYTTEFNVGGNYHRKITNPHNKIEKKVTEHFINDKVFYSDNEVGEIVRNYLIWCKK